MFKGNKDKDNNYISTEELEKMYEFQKKSFGAQIEEQNKKIEELVDFVSARFGEDVANSNIASKLKNIEKNLQEINNTYNKNIEETKKTLRKELEKESNKIATELNDAQTEYYFKLLQKNENDITDLKNNYALKEDVDKIDKNLQKYIKDGETYKKDISRELKDANQQIKNIDYTGITNKFDKKIKEKYENLDVQIKKIEEQSLNNVNKLNEQFLNNLEQVQKDLQQNAEEITKLQELIINKNEKLELSIEDNSNNLNTLEAKVTTEKENIDENIKKIENGIDLLSDQINKEKEISQENIKNVQNLFTGLQQKQADSIQALTVKIKDNELVTNKNNKNLADKIEKIKLKVKDNANSIIKLEKKNTKEIEQLNTNLLNNTTLINNLQQKTQQTDEIIVNSNEEINKLKEKIEKVNITIQAKGDQSQIEELNKILLKINNYIQNNATVISNLKVSWSKQIEQTREAINKLKEITKNKNIKLDSKINLTDDKLLQEQEKIKALEENLLLKLDAINQENNKNYMQLDKKTNEKINASIQDIILNIEKNSNDILNINNNITSIKDDTLLEVEQIKKEINKQIINNIDTNRNQLENISSEIEDIKEKNDNTIIAIQQELLNVKQQLKSIIENQDNEDIDSLKETYNKFSMKMSNELTKIGKDILNAQKKNSEQNKNLQVKIKTYIDTKIAKANNIEKIEGMINKLNLSILEREKVKKLEMEQWLDKKIKAIQKENERILNKKIEEITNKLFMQNKTNIKQNTNNVTLYEEAPRKKKNMYELIDEKQILKRSASSKTTIEPTKDEKSQILKFFYDDSDID